MTTQHPIDAQAPAPVQTVELERAVVRHWKGPVSYAVLTLVAAILMW